MSEDGGTSWSPDWTNIPDGSDAGTDRSDERSFTVTGLDNGVEHTFEVRAVSVVGDGAPASATATPMSTPTLPLSLDTIAGDDVVNIAEKAAGFAITGETGSVDAASVTVTIGSDTLTATSASSGAWTVTVPADASYLTGASVDVTVNATKAGYNAAVELTSTLAVDLVRPVLQTAELSGTSIELGYSEGLDGSSTPAADAYTVVKTDSSSATSTVGLASVDPVQVSGSVVALTLDTAVPPGDTVTVDYTAQTGMGAMPVRDTAGNAVEALAGHPVPNVPGPPASLNATAGDAQVTLTWTAPTSDGGSAVTGYEYRVSDDGGTSWSPDWTNVPDGSDTGTDPQRREVLHRDRPRQRRRAHLRGEGGQRGWRRRPGLGHVDSGHRPGGARIPERHGGRHAGEPGLDGARLRRWFRRHRVRVPCERRRRHLLES